MSKARMMADLLGSDGNVKSTKMSSTAARKGSYGRTDLDMDNQEKLTVDVSGNLTLPGTVDGRDIATDGTKLDGVEVGATNYQHPTNHTIDTTTGLQVALDGKYSKAETDAKVVELSPPATKVHVESLGILASSITGALPAISGAALTDVAPTKAVVDALGINATHISGFTVGKSVPSNAVYTDTETTTSLSHNGATKTLSYTDEAGTTNNIDLTAYVDDTNLARLVSGSLAASGIATFTRDDNTTFTIDMSDLLDTDTNTWRPISSVTNSTSTTTSASSAAVKSAYDRSWPNTTYSVGDGGLTQKNFTTADNAKLDGIETGATADQDLSALAPKASPTFTGTVNSPGYFTASSPAHTFTTAYGNITLGPRNSGYGHIQTDRASFYMNKSVYVSGSVYKYAGSAEYWHPDNDGSGSGLDADTLDGQQGSYYSPTTHQHDSRYLRLSGGTMSGNITLGVYSTTATASLVLTGSTANKQSVIKTTNGNLHIDSDADDGSAIYLNWYGGTGGIMFGDGSGASGASVSSGGVYTATGGNSTNWNTAYGWGNHASAGYTNDQTATEILTKIKTVDGSGSGLDADLLDGQQGSYFGSKEWVGSRGENLFSNGSGLLGDNTNMSSFTYDGSEANSSTGSFKYYSAGTKFTDEFMPVDVSQKYKMSVDAKTLGGTGRYYMMTTCYDVDNNSISANMHMYRANTLTTLAVALVAGATTVTLAGNGSNYYNGGTAGSSTHLRSLIIWEYTNSFGYKYPPETYSRLWYSNAWDPGAVSGNVITLRVPWAGPTYPVGTRLSNGSSGGSFKYNVMSYASIPTTWTNYSGYMDGVDYSGTNVSTKFPPGTAKVKLGWLLNYQGSGETVWFTNLKVGVASHAPSEVLTALKTVDGSGSGLDADLLDGQQGSYYYPASNPNGYTDDLTGAQLLAAIKLVDSNGTAGINAGTMDGLTLGTGVNNSANQVVRTNSDGYADFGWINTVSGSTTVAPVRIYASGDAYLRYMTPATLAPYILNQGSTKNSHTHSYAPTSTTTTANNAMPKSGGTMTGNITTPSDIVSTGRDNGLFGSYNSTQTDHIWSMGSSYKNHASGTNFGNLYGLAYKHINNTTGGTMGGSHQMVWCNNGSPRGAIGYDYVWHTSGMRVGSNTVWHAGNDGSGSGLDADLLDGMNSSAAGGYSKILASSSNGYLYINNWIHPANGTGLFYDAGVHFHESGNNMHSNTGLSSANQGYLWGASNDGSGSGLDADLLDGQQGSYYATGTHLHDSRYMRKDSANTISNYSYLNRFYSNTNGASTAGGQSSLEVYTSGAGNDAFMAFHVGGDYATYFGLDGDTNDLFVGGWSKGASRNKIWHQGNDGSGSGLDADLLDGQQGSAYLLKTGGTVTGATTFNNPIKVNSSGRTLDFGSLNSSWCHFNTTATSGFYFYDQVYSASNITAYSDIRVKTDIVHIPDSLSKVCRLNGYTFTRTDDKHKGLKQTGVIAQEVQKELPEAVVTDPENGHLSVAYGNMVGLLIEAIKEQQTQIDELKALVGGA